MKSTIKIPELIQKSQARKLIPEINQIPGVHHVDYLPEQLEISGTNFDRNQIIEKIKEEGFHPVEQNIKTPMEKINSLFIKIPPLLNKKQILKIDDLLNNNKSIIHKLYFPRLELMKIFYRREKPEENQGPNLPYKMEIKKELHSKPKTRPVWICALASLCFAPFSIIYTLPFPFLVLWALSFFLLMKDEFMKTLSLFPMRPFLASVGLFLFSSTLCISIGESFADSSFFKLVSLPLMTGYSFYQTRLNKKKLKDLEIQAGFPRLNSNVKSPTLRNFQKNEFILSDGRVKQGEADINTKALSGKDVIVKKKKGDFIYAGEFIREGNISMEEPSSPTQSLFFQFIKRTFSLERYMDDFDFIKGAPFAIICSLMAFSDIAFYLLKKPSLLESISFIVLKGLTLFLFYSLIKKSGAVRELYRHTQKKALSKGFLYPNQRQILDFQNCQRLYLHGNLLLNEHFTLRLSVQNQSQYGQKEIIRYIYSLSTYYDDLLSRKIKNIASKHGITPYQVNNIKSESNGKSGLIDIQGEKINVLFGDKEWIYKNQAGQALRHGRGVEWTDKDYVYYLIINGKHAANLTLVDLIDRSMFQTLWDMAKTRSIRIIIPETLKTIAASLLNGKFKTTPENHIHYEKKSYYVLPEEKQVKDKELQKRRVYFRKEIQYEDLKDYIIIISKSKNRLKSLINSAETYQEEYSILKKNQIRFSLLIGIGLVFPNFFSALSLLPIIIYFYLMEKRENKWMSAELN